MPVSSSVNFGRARAALRRSKPAALEAAAEIGLRASNDRVPTLSGEMEASGSTHVQGDRAAIFYTHPAAAVQHERMDYRHDDGEAKFLERGVAASRGEAAGAMADEIRKDLR